MKNVREQLREESGFVLILAMVWLLAMVFTIAAVMFSARQTNNSERNWIAMDECFLMAQSALGKTRMSIIDDFNAYYTTHRTNIDPLGDWYNLKIKNNFHFDKLKQNLTGGDGSGNSYPASWASGIYDQKIVNHNLDSNHIDLLVQVTNTLGVSSRTFQEHIRIDLKSDLFDHAYFINNKGWMFGSSIALNGKVRANGNFSFDYTPTVNGEVYASWNYERALHGSYVKGEIVNKNETGYGNYRSDDRSSYYSKWERYNEQGRLRVRDMVGTDGSGEDYHYNPEKRIGGKMPGHEHQDPLPMPYMGNLNSYIKKSSEEAANGWSYLKYTDEKGVSHTITSGVYDGAGPDGISGTVDDGTLVITGNIEVMGPVVVTGDVIIKGEYNKLSAKPGNLVASDDDVKEYLSASEQSSLSKSAQKKLAVDRKFAKLNGKGGIFSGRNVHVIGNLNSKSKTNNDDDPFLSLAARGSVVAGPYKKISEYYIKDFCQPYSTEDPAYQNTSITFKDYDGNTVTKPAFDGDYTQPEYDLSKGEGVPLSGKVVKDPNDPKGLIYYDSEDYNDLLTTGRKVNGGQIKVDGKVYNVAASLHYKQSYTVGGTPKTISRCSWDWRYRRYNYTYTDGSTGTGSNWYSTGSTVVVGGQAVSGYKVTLKENLPDIPMGTDATRSIRYYEPSVPYALINSIDSYPTQIDSVLFTNHVIGGYMGRNSVINGALIGRDEAFHFSGSISMNWDQRLGESGTGIGKILSMLLPRTFDPTYSPKNKKLLYWCEIY